MKVEQVWLISYMIMNLEKYSQLAFFAGLQTTDIQLLEPYFAPQTWVAGTKIFEQDDYAEFLYLVVNGEVTIRYSDQANEFAFDVVHLILEFQG